MNHILEIGDEKRTEEVVSFNGHTWRYHDVNVDKGISSCYEPWRRN
jgi:hypothetical protein